MAKKRRYHDWYNYETRKTSFLEGFWMTVFTIALCVGFFGFIETRVLCSHCPHYAEEGASLRCWANYGSPKLFKYRPGPMSTTSTRSYRAP